MSIKILIIEDEKRTAEWMSIYLERADYLPITAYDGKTGLDLARSGKPDLILLDILLPRLNGAELCRILRKESDVPIIMVTSRGAREDLLKGLNDGADDYIVKPFDPDELIARIGALLRRTNVIGTQNISCGPFLVDSEKESVSMEGRELLLSHAQFSLLKVFLSNPGRVLSREQLIEMAFDGNFDGYERAIDAHIKRLRKIIHTKDFTPLETVYGAGYRLVCS